MEKANLKRKGDTPWETKAEKKTRIRVGNRRKAKRNKRINKSKISNRKGLRERIPEQSKDGNNLVTVRGSIPHLLFASEAKQ